MSSWILVVYVLCAAVAVGLLYAFGMRRWYLHAISALAGLVLGLMPPPSGVGGSWFYLATGSLFILLFFWGAGGPLFRLFHLGREQRRHGVPVSHAASG